MGAPGDVISGIELGSVGARQVTPRHHRGGIVESVDPGSTARGAGVNAGDIILSVNGHRLRDVVDFQFYAADAVVSMEILRPGSVTPEVVHIVREAGQGIGVSFTQPTFAPIRECNNHCPFCFIDQLPAEMRASLYIRDDDYRYSFLFGNFVTLTNLNERDWRRLSEQKLSPLYVSVHSTEQSLRRLLLGNDRAPDVLAQLDRLASVGIRMHTQVVVCPGMNDGTHLEKTVSDLVGRYPNVLSVGVVPVGLTRTPAEILAGPAAACSRILPSAVDLPLRQFQREEAAAVVRQVAGWQRDQRRSHGLSLVYASDEFYLLAGKTVPAASSYDGYPQYENGIGMVRDLLDDWSRRRRRRLTRPLKRRHPTRVSLICAEMIAPVLAPLVAEWSDMAGVSANVVVLSNSFFGSRVRVSGLLTGRDVLAARDRIEGDLVILPKVMLDKTGTKLLDNMTPAQLEDDLALPVAFAGMMSEVDDLIGALAA